MRNKFKLHDNNNIEEENTRDYIIVGREERNVYTVFLDGDILPPSHYREAVHLLKVASPLDSVVFRISSSGGDLSSGVLLANAIRDTEAETLAIVDTYACSAASLIPMVTDDVVMMGHSFMMIHSAVYGTFDDVQKVQSYIAFQDERLYALMNDYYKGFLSDKEIDDVVYHSKEIWLTDEDVMKRLGNREDNISVSDEELKELMDAIDLQYSDEDENE